MCAKFLNPFKLEVKTPAIIKINPCPNENINSIKTASRIFVDIDANAIIPARIGVEQGVPAIANTAPIKIGNSTIFFPVLCGICLIITGILKSNTPTTFSPITNNNDASSKIKYTGAKETKTFPVTAQIMPSVANTIDEPNTKNSICKNILAGFSLEYPPTYPTIIGSIANEHGDIEAKRPPRNETASIISPKCPELAIP